MGYTYGQYPWPIRFLTGLRGAATAFLWKVDETIGRRLRPCDQVTSRHVESPRDKSVVRCCYTRL
jgi:hypothetical protein